MNIKERTSEKAIDRFRRESNLFKQILVSYLLVPRLKDCLRSLTKNHLAGLGAATDEINDTLLDMDKRSECHPGCWSSQDLISHIEAHLMPVLRACRQESTTLQAKKKAKIKKKVAPLPPPRPNALHKVPLGFGSALVKTPVVLLGAPADVRQAIEYVLRETATSSVLYFSREITRGERWKETAERRAKVFAPDWNFCLHRGTHLTTTAMNLSAEAGVSSFDLLVVEDCGVDPTNIDEAMYRKLSIRFMARAEAVCKKLLAWGRPRSTAIVTGLHIPPGESYRQVELFRLTEFCDVFKIAMDDGVLCAQDAQGHLHPLDNHE